MMRTKRQHILITIRDPKHLKWRLDKRIQRLVSPGGYFPSDLQHRPYTRLAFPCQPEKSSACPLAQWWPAPHKMGQHLRHVFTADRSFQLGFDTELHQHT